MRGENETSVWYDYFRCLERNISRKGNKKNISKKQEMVLPLQFSPHGQYVQLNKMGGRKMRAN